MTTVEQLPEIARRLGERLAERLHDEPLVHGIWVLDSPRRLDFWLLTDETDVDGERRLQAAARFLYEVLPEIDVLLHILNPACYAGSDPVAAIPDDATEILLRAA